MGTQLQPTSIGCCHWSYSTFVPFPLYLKVTHFKLKVLLKTRILTAPSDVCRIFICSRCHKYSYCLLCCDHVHAQCLCKYLFTNSGFGHLRLKCCFCLVLCPKQRMAGAELILYKIGDTVVDTNEWCRSHLFQSHCCI